MLPMLITCPIAFGSDHELQQRADDVGDVREGALLRAVAEHRDRLAGERLPDEIRDHHPVLSRSAAARPC